MGWVNEGLAGLAVSNSCCRPDALPCPHGALSILLCICTAPGRRVVPPLTCTASLMCDTAHPCRYIKALEPFYDTFDPDFVSSRKAARQILQKEDDLNEIVQLVGKVGGWVGSSAWLLGGKRKG